MTSFFTRNDASERASDPLLAVASLLLVWGVAPAFGADLIVDATAESGVDFVYFNGMSGELYFAEMMGGGVAMLDYDGDGDVDLFLPQGEMLGDKPLSEATFPPAADRPLSDRLFRNDLWVDAEGRPRLVFEDVTEAAGISPGGYGMGVASGDLDNDGFPDLYVTNFGSNRLLVNQGDGTFADRTMESGTDDRRWSVAASFLDIDGDDLLDLYVGNYVEHRIATHRGCFNDTGVLDYCGPGGFPSESDRLFRNLGNGVFEDVTRRSGVGAQEGAGLGSVSGDFDRDGRADLFVANDGERNFLWLNQGDGTFTDDALLAGTAVSAAGQPEASMGVVLGDLNNDGHEDLFMSHLNSETNTLYLGSASGMFDDASNDSGLGLPSWKYTGFGISLFDFDNDADQDLFVANGAVKRIEELHRAGDPYPLHQINQLYRNEGDGRFVEITDDAGGALELSEVSRGVASGDLDLDGDVDLVVVNSVGPVRLFANAAGAENSWIAVKVLGGSVGSEVSLGDSEGRIQRRRIATDGSYASAQDPSRVFGLGRAADPLWLQIRRPAGRAVRVLDPPIEHRLVFPGEME